MEISEKENKNEETLKFSTRLSSNVLYWKVGAKLIQGMIWNEDLWFKNSSALNQNERFLTGTFNKYLLMKQDQELLLFMTLKEMDLLISKKIQCSSSPDPNWTTKCVAFTKTLKQMITASDGEAFHKLQISNAFNWRRIHTQHQSPIWFGKDVSSITRIDGMEKSFYHSHQEDGYSHCIFIKHWKEICSRMLWWIDHFK